MKYRFAELTLLMAQSRNPEELKHAWYEFRRHAGDRVRKEFVEYVALTNEAAKLNSEWDRQRCSTAPRAGF